MFQSKVFRQRALSHHARPEPLDARLQVTAPHEWMALAGLGIAIVALLLWSVFGSVERSVTASAVLVQSGERHEVVSPASGHVVEVLAAVGDAVGRGQTIARVYPLEGQREARIVRRIVSAVEDKARSAGGAAATVQLALLQAAGDELRRIEMSAAQSIVAPRDGTLVSLDLALGRPVRGGDIVARLRDGAADAWQALASVSAQDAEELTVGQAAKIMFPSPGEPEGRVLDARVLEVSSRPIATPEWLLDIGFSADAPAYLLRLALPGAASAEGGTPAEGASGTVRVLLGRRSLAALLLAHGI